MKDIKGYEGLYAITSCGKVWSYRRKKFLKPGMDSNGYLQVILYKDGEAKHQSVSRLVAKAYIENPKPEEYDQVGHRDETPLHNWVGNLYWTNAKENCNYGHRNERVSKALIKPIYCVELDRVFESASVAAEELNLCASGITHCCNGRIKSYLGKHWKYIEKEIKMKPLKKGPKKPIYCVELDRVFESAVAAAEELKLSTPGISQCCNGKQKTTGGYHFRFATESEITAHKLKTSLDELAKVVKMDLHLERIGEACNSLLESAC